MKKKLKKIFLKFRRCPLCNFSKKTSAGQGYKNRYSDQISQLLKISEDKLIEQTKNVRCKQCGLIYKLNWFKKNFYKKILDELSPVHPRGWDTNSERFSKNSLRMEIKNYLRDVSRSRGLGSEILRASKRKVSSIIDSIEVKSIKQTRFKENFLKKIESNQVEYINSNKKKIIRLLKQPERFKRFKNFSEEPMFKYINKHVKKMYYYGEIGCPLWGMIKIAKKNGCKTKFIKGDKNYFWNTKCKYKNKTCCSVISKDVNSVCNDIDSYAGKKLDFLGVFNYFDHLTDPLKTIKQFLLVTKSLGFIFEVNSKKNKGVPVQHFTGWSKKTMVYLAKKFNKKINFDFKDIKKSGNEFYLLH